MPRRLVIKIGGSTLGQHDTTLEDLAWLQTTHGSPRPGDVSWPQLDKAPGGRLDTGIQAVVVHGGGKTITDWLERMKVPTRFANGLRITDEESIGVVNAVLSGLINKQLVASINALGGRAIGLSGVDAAIVRASIKDPALGLVGDPRRIDPAPLEALLAAGFLPVLSPIGVQDASPPSTGASATTRPTSTLLNINADTVAAAIGGALHADDLLFFTDVPGVKAADGAVIPRLPRQEALALIASGVISGGMVPKVEACLTALSYVPSTRIVDGRQPHALRDYVAGKIIGTTVVAA